MLLLSKCRHSKYSAYVPTQSHTYEIVQAYLSTENMGEIVEYSPTLLMSLYYEMLGQE